MFELRSYRAVPGHMPDLIRRFREHTLDLFARHGMHSLGYWHPVDDPDVLIYILWHEGDPQDQWEAFLSDPDWITARAESTTDGPITESVEFRFIDLVTDLPGGDWPGDGVQMSR